jgi:hypothetical protein
MIWYGTVSNSPFAFFIFCGERKEHAYAATNSTIMLKEDKSNQTNAFRGALNLFNGMPQYAWFLLSKLKRFSFIYPTASSNTRKNTFCKIFGVCPAILATCKTFDLCLSQ